MQANRIGREAAIDLHNRKRQWEARKAYIRRKLEIVFAGISVALFVFGLWLFWVLTPSGMVKCAAHPGASWPTPPSRWASACARS